MNLENNKAQMRKGVLEYCILAMLKHKDGYVAELLDGLKTAELLVVEGTLYPLLTRLKNAGFLDYRWEESNSGPPRKYYQLTKEGSTFLDDLHQSWTSLNASVAMVTQNNNKTSKAK